MRFLETKDDVAQLGQVQPVRHLAAQHTALGVGGARSLAGDHEREFGPVVLSATEKARERRVRLRLGHAVQIDARIDRGAAAHKLLLFAPRQRCEPRRARRFGGRGRGPHGLRGTCRVGSSRRCDGLRLRDPRVILFPRGALAQRLDQARDAAPQLVLLRAQLAPAHGLRFVLALTPRSAVRPGGATFGCACRAIRSTGRGSGIGIFAPASTGSISRGISIANWP